MEGLIFGCRSTGLVSTVRMLYTLGVEGNS